eukprot:TRINITY_DN5473_c0_g1_i1.p1 TRINITY_DN5473_c0_g1~~TRINITY_DN5473_c0_g1_i1.p1  ORF type:complete len:547 (+),score=86.52 TRINITY_DN5473_c0_g1_i1:34-1641(+)
MLVLAVIAAACTAAAAAQQGYTAGVALHSPLGNLGSQTPREIVRVNIQAYVTYLTLVTEQLDIAVFPESGTGYLTWAFNRTTVQSWCEEIPYVFNGQPVVNPCTDPQFAGDDHYQLRTMACTARNFSTVIVFNLGEISPCNENDAECPPDGHYQYNTDVAISETGQLLAVYHKSHLANEAHLFDQPPQPDPVWFDTAFGVRFGLQTCYDGNFADPVREEYKNGVRDFIWPMYSGDMAPILSSAMTASAVSRFYESNFLTANGYYVGCGIYSCGEVVASLGPFSEPTRKFVVGSITSKADCAAVKTMRVPQKIVSLPSLLPATKLPRVPAQFGAAVEGPHDKLPDGFCMMRSVPFKCAQVNATAGASGQIALNLTFDKFGTSQCVVTYSVEHTEVTLPSYAVISGLLDVPGRKDTPWGLTTSGCSIVYCPNFPTCLDDCPENDPLCFYDGVSVFSSVEVDYLMPDKFDPDQITTSMSIGVASGQPLRSEDLSFTLDRTNPKQWQTIKQSSLYVPEKPLMSASIVVTQRGTAYTPRD